MAFAWAGAACGSSASRTLPVPADGTQTVDAVSGELVDTATIELTSDLAAADAPAQDAALDVPEDVSPMHAQFAFVLIADPHVVGPGENLQRLDKAVAWINAERSSRSIELALVLGDLGWGSGGGLTMARKALDKLQLPYAAVIGDNEVHGGSEAEFDAVFGPHDATLTTQVEGFERAPTPTVDPANGMKSWFQNLAFEYRGVRFVGLDWSARVDGTFAGDQGDLHDYPGATLPWLAKQMKALGKRPAESVVLFSHIPMHESPGAFFKDEMQAILDIVSPVGGLVSAAYGGHYHFDYEQVLDDAGYTLWVTASPFNGPLRLRVVQVSSNGATFAYSQELVDVPFP